MVPLQPAFLRSGAVRRAILLAALLPPVTFPASALAVPSDAEHDQLLTILSQLRGQVIWPVDGSGANEIDETFGPRLQPSTDLYDWHRGIDLDSVGGLHTTIVAPDDGQFYRYNWLSDSAGWTLVLRHDLPQPVAYNGWVLHYYYTYFLHLDDSAKPAWLVAAIADDNAQPSVKRLVARGTAVATMGNSGQSEGGLYDQHLHYEVRVGTPSSLEFQIANPGSTQWGFDPHLHPLLLYPAPAVSIQIETLAPISPLATGRFRLLVNNDDWPGLNRITVVAVDTLHGGQELGRHTLDFNRRLGYNAASTELLDLRDETKPYMEPQYFTPSQTDYFTDLAVPAAFVSAHWGAGVEWIVSVEDIWGHTASLSHPPPSALQAWRYAHFASLEGSGNAADLANPAGDGLPNLLKYAFNLNPHAPDAAVLTPAIGIKGLPAHSLTPGPNSYLRLEFVRRTVASQPEIQYEVQGRLGAGNWAPADGMEIISPIDAFWERVVWTDEYPVGPGPARQVRLRISLED